jgi:hypothetical protein
MSQGTGDRRWFSLRMVCDDTSRLSVKPRMCAYRIIFHLVRRLEYDSRTYRRKFRRKVNVCDMIYVLGLEERVVPKELDEAGSIRSL